VVVDLARLAPCGDFELPSPRNKLKNLSVVGETPKNVTKKSRKTGLGFFFDFFCPVCQKVFVVLLNSSLATGNVPCLHVTGEKNRGKTDIDFLVFGKSFRHGILVKKYFCGDFELPLPSNAQKRTKKAFNNDLYYQLRAFTRGGQKKKERKRRTSAPARQKKYIRTSFFFSAFLGVSRRKGSSKTREKK
jgi:hypothetical protein